MASTRSARVCVDIVVCTVLGGIYTMHTPVVIANVDAMVLQCLFQIKICIPYDEVKLHIGSIKSICCGELSLLKM